MDKQALQAALEQQLAGLDRAQVNGHSRNFEPGDGRVRFVDVELVQGQRTMFIATCEIVWFRGGLQINDPSNPADVQRLPDDLFRPGDEVAFKINLGWANNAAFPHIKAWTWAVLQRAAARDGLDPSSVRQDQASRAKLAEIMANFERYAGLECDFRAEHTTTRSGGLFTRVTWLPLRDARPTAAPAQPAPVQPVAASNPLAALIANAPSELSRDAKIAALREYDPTFASVNFGELTDEQINAAHKAIPPF